MCSAAWRKLGADEDEAAAMTQAMLGSSIDLSADAQHDQEEESDDNGDNTAPLKQTSNRKDSQTVEVNADDGPTDDGSEDEGEEDDEDGDDDDLILENATMSFDEIGTKLREVRAGATHAQYGLFVCQEIQV